MQIYMLMTSGDHIRLKFTILDYNKNVKNFWKIQVTEIIFCNCLSGKLETSGKVESENHVEIVELPLGYILDLEATGIYL